MFVCALKLEKLQISAIIRTKENIQRISSMSKEKQSLQY